MSWLLASVAFFARFLPRGLILWFYRKPTLARFFRQVLNRAAPSGLRQVTVATGALKGFTLLLDLQSEKDYWLGTYEVELQDALQQLVEPGMTAYDVGANIGYITLILARLTGENGRVFAFEALPSNGERWQTNLTLNGMKERSQLFSGAVTDRQSQVRFLVHASGGMGKVAGSAGREQPYEMEILVPGLSLDEFVFSQGNPAPQIIKLDIEGGEVLALPGMRRLLLDEHPILLMELHGQESSRVGWQMLSEMNYKICWMRPGFPKVPALEDLDWKAYLVALPEVE